MSENATGLAAALADRYRIECELGSGGAAVVYLAEDLKHHRQVAVKVLRPELAAIVGGERFLKEIEVTAGLNHPHILPLFDSGEADSFLFYVMPYVEGGSLRTKLNREKQLSIEEAIHITEQVAAALEYAHGREIIHRDIKPENILLQDGHLLVADFGIALALGSADSARITETGVSLGTPHYMSPEQGAGEPTVDRRSDLYSLACVLYEMLAGEPPFTGPTAQAVIVKHVSQTIPSIAAVRPTVGTMLDRVVQRALAKAPVDRFASAADFAAALTGPDDSVLESQKSIVVLPFQNLSPDPANSYFTDGLTEEIITDLSSVRALRVISRTSAMQLKGTEKNLQTIARELNVRYVLEGSVRKAGDTLRITAQLIDAENDAHVWAGKHTGTLEDVFDIQEKVSRSIVDALKLTLSAGEEQQMRERPIENVQAYECYLRARDEFWRFTPEALERATKHFRNGLATVGENALLYAGLGRTYVQYWLNAIRFDEAFLRQAEECAEKCLALAPDAPHGHVILAMTALFDRAELRDATIPLKHALRLAPDDPDALAWLGALYIERGKLDAARPLLERAVQLDPLTPAYRMWTGQMHWQAGRFRNAVEATQKGHDLNPENTHSALFHGLSLRFAGRDDEAEAVLRAPLHHATGFQEFMLSIFLAAWGDDRSELEQRCATADGAIARRVGLWSLWVAECHALVGAHDDALDWLEHAVGRRVINYPFLSELDPFLANIRGEPRFKQLMERVKREWEAFE